MEEHIQKSLSLVVKDLLVPLAKDLFGSSAKVIGDFSGAALGLVFIPITELCKINTEKFCEKIREKLEKIPEENRVTPDEKIAYGVLREIPYISEEDIQEMYAELLSKTCDKNYSGKIIDAHKGIISDLSPDEAKILNKLSTELYNSVPIIKICIKQQNPDVRKILVDRYTNLFDGLIENKANIPTYLNNLERLGLINTELDNDIIDVGKPVGANYELIENSDFVNETLKILGQFPGYHPKFYRGRMDVTDLGVSFMKAVTQPK